MIGVGRAAAAAALVAALVYATALRNGFVQDDVPIVRRNPVAHSIGAAIAAFDQPYWPPKDGAGLYRPLVLLSFAADWQVSRGSTVWLHAVNVGWHAAATGLLVPVLAAYVGVGAALAGALLFAVHPVHVEAVANLVGRAEPMAAVFLFGALLLARAVRRRRAAGRRTAALEAALLGAVGLALLTKEHAAVAIALLALDDFGTRERGGPSLPWRSYAAVAALTLVWYVVRRRIEGDIAFTAVAPTFVLLGTAGRLSTMLPAVFVILRLLVWPFDLSADYHPRVIERLEHLTLEGAAGAAVLAALAALAVLTWRRNRPVSLGLLFAGVAWAPTANLLFPSGVVVAERTLYLASAGVVLVAAEGARRAALRWGALRVAVGVGVLGTALAAQTVTSIGTWKNNRELVLAGMWKHPESYRVHQAAARVLLRMDRPREALAEYGVSAELFPLEVANLVEAARAAADAGDPRMAERFLAQAGRAGWGAALIAWGRAYVAVREGDAAGLLARSRGAALGSPPDPTAARITAGAFLALGHPDSARALWPAFLRAGGSPYFGWLFRSSTFAASGMPDSARWALDSCRAHLPDDPTARADLARLRVLIAGADTVPPASR